MRTTTWNEGDISGALLIQDDHSLSLQRDENIFVDRYLYV